MKKTNESIILSTGFLILVAMTPQWALAKGSAETTQVRNNYIGASMGMVQSLDCSGLDECSSSPKVWKAYGGVQAAQGFKVETGYLLADKVTSSSKKYGNSTSELKGYTVAGVLDYPVSPALNVVGKVGYLFGKLSYQDKVVGKVSGSNRSLFFSGGVDYNFSDNLSVRGEWERYGESLHLNGRKQDLNVLSVGLVASSL